MQAASVKGWRDISSVFSDKSKSLDSDTALSPDDQLVTGITGYGSRFICISIEISVCASK